MKITYKDFTENFTDQELAETKILAHTSVNGRSKDINLFLDKLDLAGTCVEIGTYRGVSATILTSYFDKVYTFDIAEQKVKYKVWERMDVLDKIESYVLPSRGHIRTKLHELKLKINFVFIDGRHTFWDAGSDYLMCAELGCQVFVFHDCNKKHPLLVSLMKILGGTIYENLFGYIKL